MSLVSINESTLNNLKEIHETIFIIPWWMWCLHVRAHGLPVGELPDWTQVWSLTQLVLFPFCKKIIDCLEGKSMTHCRGKYCSLPFLPATPSSPSRALLPELQRIKDTVRCAALGAKVPGHRQEQLPQTLIARLLKTHFFVLILIVKSQQNHHKQSGQPYNFIIGCLHRH